MIMEEILFDPSKRFSSESLPAFIEHLDRQMADDNLYSLDNNIAILKLFLLYPKCNDVSVCEKILIKALTRIPQPDFDVCLFQLPLSVKRDPSISSIVNLYNLLQDCKFNDFWAALKKTNFAMNKGVITGARNFALEVISLAYHKISIADFIILLDLENEKVAEKLAIEQNWQVANKFIQINSNLDTKGSKSSQIDKHMRPESIKHCLTLLDSIGKIPGIRK
ncbi:Eukaryotic translation initiation factor 3 subunit K [Babesia microti strain RI]|uniref:Eukaryotic translation initiation factor 3 subunit K n=1 Tax=Babesia microti (strain RI) TaxID=1133968 RepID=A0A0K3ARV9_BABMR|nr:Eukaryotic translation initiation factor 3 subunit K [Babesia microti strain RI]CTQ41195.1 Eukaryotic translation initiation factor 3 subunit K [Babesia microti strain RI]|eukprot:XP_012649206.1 Eukaryotic translation initiation factor 3 subunit K [Babesia microti strain RI]